MVAKKSEKDRDVFISYSSANGGLAKTIEQAIVNAGGTAFLSVKDIYAGEDFAEIIRENLIKARQLWIILSPQSINSEWVLTEWGAAWGLGKPIIPILYRIDINDLPARLQRLQCIDFHDYPKLIAEKFPKKESVSTPTNDEKIIIEDLLSRGKIIDAVAEGRKYLVRGEFVKSLAVLEYMRDIANSAHQDYYIILGNIAYNFVHLGRDKEALEYLETVEKLCPEPFFPWHATARSAAYFHLKQDAECIKWLRYAESHPLYDENETRKHYPELTPYLSSIS